MQGFSVSQRTIPDVMPCKRTRKSGIVRWAFEKRERIARLALDTFAFVGLRRHLLDDVAHANLLIGDGVFLGILESEIAE